MDRWIAQTILLVLVLVLVGLGVGWFVQGEAVVPPSELAQPEPAGEPTPAPVLASGQRVEPLAVPASERSAVAPTPDPVVEAKRTDGPQLYGRVLMPDGTPVGRGRLLVRARAGGALKFALPIEDGSFEVAVKDGATHVEVRATGIYDQAGRRANVLPYAARVAVGGAIQIQLQEGRRVPGVLVDEAGKPLQHYLSGRSLSGTDLSVFPNKFLRPDAEGRFELLGLAPGERVRVDVPATGAPPTIVEPDQTHVRIVLPAAGRIRGRVVDEQGQALVGAFVHAKFGDDSRSAQTRAEGAFSIRVPRGATGRVIATRTTRESAYHRAELRDVQEGRMDLVLRLRRAHILRGIVVDPAGKPVSGVPVQAKRSRYGRGVRSNEKGEFHIAPLEAGTHTVSSGPFGTWLGAAPRSVTLPTSEPIVLRLRKALVLSGRVQGEDVEGLEVVFTQSGRGGHTDRVRARADGSFTIALAAADPGLLYVIDQERNRFAMQEDVSPRPDGVVLQLQEGLRIEGRLEGEVSEHTNVFAHGPPIYVNHVPIEGRRFVIAGLPPGRYMLFARGNAGSATGRVDGVEAGATDVVIRLKPRPR